MPNVILAFDGSEQSLKAIDCLSWMDRQALDVIVACAVDGPAINEQGDAVDADPEAFGRAETGLAASLQRLRERGIEARSRIIVGDPATAIVALAVEVNADLIVTGSRGLGFAKRMVLGSTSTAIFQRAPCTVMIAR